MDSVEAKTPIPVFGAYFNGNFGDDLMAHLIAERLNAAGYAPRLWRGPTDAYAGRQWPVAEDMESFLEGARCVVCGGGMVLAISDYRDYWQDFQAMAEACVRRDIPVIAISVGSDGLRMQLHPAVQFLIDSGGLRAASCRLKDDAAWLRRLGVPCSYIPDIVLTSGLRRPRREIKRVLLCLSVHPVEAHLLNWTCKRLEGAGMVVYTMGQRTDGTHEIAQAYHGHGTRLANSGLDSVVAAIGEADVVVASGLHVGVAAMAAGAEFVSYRGTGKTRDFMSECGHRGRVLEASGRVGKLLCAFRLARLVLSISPRENDPVVQDLQQAAQEHFAFMLEHLDRIHR